MNKVYEIVTDRIIAELEKGTIPWRQPWKESRRPVNLVSRKPYRGINVILLRSTCHSSPYWLTFKQATDLGGHVRKGEKGIAIFAPMRFKKESDKGEIESRIAFRVVHVFDVSQTDGAELPTVEAPNIDSAADNLLADLVRVADSRGIAVTFRALSGGKYGTSAKGAIEVDNTHATGQQAKTFAHELAHESLHWVDRGSLTRSIAELEAGSVAYVVCRHFALDTSIRSSAYIALWNGDGKAMRESMDRIAKTARAIIDDCVTAANRKAVA